MTPETLQACANSARSLVRLALPLTAGALVLVPANALLAAAPAAPISITLAPQRGQHDPATIERIRVGLELGAASRQAEEPLVEIPLLSSNVDTVATLISDLVARDSAGPLRLIARRTDQAERGSRDSVAGGPALQWFPARTPRGAVKLTYSFAARQVLPVRGPAPPLGISADGGGVSAAGGVFLLLPPDRLAHDVSLRWNLAGAPKGARAVTSLGERATINTSMTVPDLRDIYFMAGKVQTWPKRVPATGFFSAWHGNPTIPAEPTMAWTGTLYGHFSTFFGQKAPPPYAVFMRYNPINAGGGVGLNHSFVVTFGAGGGSDVDAMKITLSHEMFHTFQPYISMGTGLDSSWFAEGLATFYQSRLPERFGLLSADQFLADLNRAAGRYYTSIMADLPNAKISERFWQDTRVRTLAYDRGMLYFAGLDYRIRQASAGKRSLDDVMREMLAMQAKGTELTEQVWEQLLTRELGADAVEDYHRFIAGRIELPPSEAFGPCFRRTTKPMRRYELGFEPAVLSEPRRVVRGLVAGSAAERAGLRDGDVILRPVPQDAIQGDQTAKLVLSVERDGKSFDVAYQPRGETVDAFQWERISGVPDDKCGL